MNMKALQALQFKGMSLFAFSKVCGSSLKGQAAMDELLRSGTAAFNGRILTITEDGKRQLHKHLYPNTPYQVAQHGSRSLMSGVLTPSRPVYREGSEDAFKHPSLVAGKRIPYGVNL